MIIKVFFIIIKKIKKVWKMMDGDSCGKVLLRDFTRGCGHVVIAHAFGLDDARLRVIELCIPAKEYTRALRVLTNKILSVT